MGQSELKLRSLLLQIDRQLTDSERKRLCFLIGPDDVPRRLIDMIDRDNSATMEMIWQTLFDRRKIAVDNVNYLIERLETIERFDLATLLKNFCPVPFSLVTTPNVETNHRIPPSTIGSNLFIRIDP